MNLLSAIRVALISLRVNALRTVLAMLGVIIGVSAVIVMVSVTAKAPNRRSRNRLPASAPIF